MCKSLQKNDTVHQEEKPLDVTVRKMTIDDAIYKVVYTALNEVDYREKASNYMLDNKYANAGSANYTKYARDLDNIDGFYNGKKQGYAYCDIFNDWVFVKCFGVDIAMKMLYQPKYSAGAGCTFSLQYYKNNNAFSTVPKVGYQIFFGNYYESTHTGIVVDVRDNVVYTVEGNTSNGVFKRSYKINDSKIIGYGIPNYSLVVGTIIEDEEIPQNNPVEDDIGIIFYIKDVQKFLNKNYINVFKDKLETNGIYNQFTKNALVMSVQKELGVDINGNFSLYNKKKFPILTKRYKGSLVKLVQCALICNGFSVGKDGADGDYGQNTANAVKKFQRIKYLEIDGECGPETAYKLFN